MSLDPKIWGPKMWFALHSITLTYPECPTINDKKDAEDFFLLLGNLLPCKKCRKNYDDHLKEYPLTDEILSEKEKLVRWLFNIHNEVNETTGKRKITYDEFINIYKDEYNKTNKFNYKILVFVLIIILAILFFYFFRSKIILDSSSSTTDI